MLTKEDLELLTTVDMAACDLARDHRPIDVEGIKAVIQGHPEWEAKLDRVTFSDEKIAAGLRRVRELLPEVPRQ